MPMNELERRNKINNEEFNWIRLTAARCPVLFCQPKVHKAGMPLHPVISTFNSYNYNLSKYLTHLLEKARNKPSSYIKDLFTFTKLIQQPTPSKNDFMISLGVESLFT